MSIYQPTQEIEESNSIASIASSKSIDAMIYLQDILEGGNSGPANAEIDNSDADAEYDSDASDFCSVSSSKLQEDTIDEPLEPRSHGELASNTPQLAAAFGLPADTNRNNQRYFHGDHPTLQIHRTPRLRKQQDRVAVSRHETGGEYCGIVQLSGQLFRPNSSISSFEIIVKTFSKYVRPPDGVFWNEEACRASHGLTATSPQILSESPFVSVWEEFTTWIGQQVRPDEKCILCAYRGEMCDMQWIWRGKYGI